MIGFDDAQALLARHVEPLGREVVALSEATGCYLAEAVIARSDSPRQSVSAMDGYAVREATTRPGDALEIIGESRAGSGFGRAVGEGEAVRIFTGAALPPGTDCVIMQEYAERTGDRVVFAKGYGPERHVREGGSDFATGAQLVAPGTRLGPGAMVAAAAADIDRIMVFRRPRIALIATGDELAPPGTAHLAPDSIPDSVSFGVAATVEAEGGLVAFRETGADELASLVELADAALDSADLVVVIGGASVGERDFAKPMFAQNGLTTIFDKLAIKPGRPVWFGETRGKFVLGLPGNPTSAMVTAALFLRPILRLLQGGSGDLVWRRFPLATDLGATGSRETFVRAVWEEQGLAPLVQQDSGSQAALASADWLIRCSAESPALPAGSKVMATMF